MVQAAIPALIPVLKQPLSQDVLDALLYIKNSIIGHDHRKEDAVKQGLVEPLVALITTSPVAGAANNANDVAHHSVVGSSLRTIQQQVRHQSVIIIASLASAGISFVPPLLSAGVVTPLLQLIVHEGNIALATDALRAISDLTSSQAPRQGVDNHLYTSERAVFDSSSHQLFQQVVLKVSSLQSSRHDALLCNIIAAASIPPFNAPIGSEDSILDYLLTLLETFHWQSRTVHNGEVTSQVRLTHNTIVSLFRALYAVIIADRHHRRSLRKILMTLAKFEAQPDHFGQHPQAGNGNISASSRPPAHTPMPKGHRSIEQTLLARQDDFQAAAMIENMSEYENRAIFWLIETARSLSDTARLKVLCLLGLVHVELLRFERLNHSKAAAEQYRRTRCKPLARSVVPLCIKLIQDHNDTTPQTRDTTGEGGACSALEMLIRDTRELQIAAVEAGAIKYVCPLLRRTFDKITLSKPIWTSHNIPNQDLPDTCRMGHTGLPKEIARAMRSRAEALDALAALADQDEVHRKAIFDSGIISCMVDSLKPFPRDDATQFTADSIHGNTSFVIRAACQAIKNLSRSVSLLRTSLIDAGVARPISELLNHHEPGIQIAATDVCANLMLECSPMREQLAADGSLNTLCDHAKNGSSALKLSSMWALKHSVHEASTEQRKKTLHNLGIEWLVAAIAGNAQSLDVPYDRAGGGVRLRSANAAGDKVDLLNPSSMDVDNGMQADPGEEEVEDGEDEDTELYFDEASNTHYQSSSLRSTIPHTDKTILAEPFHDSDLTSADASSQAQRDDIALQQQALDFLRNLLNGDNCAEMVTHIFNEFGRQRLYSLLIEKLAPIQPSYPQQTTANGTGRPVYYSTTIVKSAIHVVNHIANGGISQKEDLIAQRPLLQAMLPHFSHPDADVRVTCVWLIHSLTWKEGEYDTGGRTKRAHELMGMGIFKAVQDLERDPSLDVRSRVSVVLRQFKEA